MLDLINLVINRSVLASFKRSLASTILLSNDSNKENLNFCVFEQIKAGRALYRFSEGCPA